jgi:hypothetical protein
MRIIALVLRMHVFNTMTGTRLASFGEPLILKNGPPSVLDELLQLSRCSSKYPPMDIARV